MWKKPIMTGALAAGERIHADALARQFKVSQIPVREARTHLEAVGLIVQEPHKLTRYLLRIMKESKYGDSMERVMYNTVLGAKPLQQDGALFISPTIITMMDTNSILKVILARSLRNGHVAQALCHRSQQTIA